ncbi:hypothetical protein [Roseovarius indicus]|uniref:Lipoprotein n=1 Tax=Roseovarius indicus TaxID=540747 RepID=A0A0T5P2L5_9RHOB|nr:hypothetical protein [Roseovarius indicus]KRS15368.1 hypothetical protein XM52_24270 [Roseovarius indicus]QEW28705.1 hypothetical protein RIdsm_04544 [Roseovarius indicus]SFE68541.1 hypothetical protein SAMN04488031_11640 [Roseovarius indicus]
MRVLKASLLIAGLGTMTGCVGSAYSPTGYPADAARFRVDGTDRVVSRDEMPEDFKRICLPHYNDPNAAEAAFDTSGRYVRTSALRTSFSRLITYKGKNDPRYTGVVSVSRTELAGCTIAVAGTYWRVYPNGTITVGKSAAQPS